MANGIGENSVARHLLAKRRANADWYYGSRETAETPSLTAPARTRREVLRMRGAYKHLCTKRLRQADRMYYNAAACPTFKR